MGSVRMPQPLEARVREIAESRGITRSEVFRRALERYCDEELAEPKGSRYDDVIGIFDGPEEGSSRVSEYFVQGLEEKYGKHNR